MATTMEGLIAFLVLETFLVLKFVNNSDGSDNLSFLEVTQDILMHSDVYFVTGISNSSDFSVERRMYTNQKFQISYNFGALGFILSNETENIGILNHGNLKIVVDVNNKEEIPKIIAQISSSTKFLEISPQLWTIVYWPEKVQSESDAEEILRRIEMDTIKNYNVNSELYFAFYLDNQIPNGANNSQNIVYYELYTITNNIVYNKVQNLGDTIVTCEECDSFTTRRSDFRGSTLNIIGVEDTEFNDDTSFENNNNGSIAFKDGYSIRILKLISNNLNFTVKAMKTYEWGTFFPENNSWYGAVQEILEGKADFCISETAMTPERAKAILFLPSTSENIVSAFFKTPDLNAIRDIFAQPFKADLWAAVITTWIVLASLMIIFSLIRKRYNVNEDSDEPEPDFTQDSFICALAMACQQGWDEHPSAGSLRTIFISGSFTGVVAYAGYSAAIVSTLSLRIDPIQSPAALLQSNLRLGIRDGFINEVLQQTSVDDVLSKFHGRLSSHQDERMLNISAGYQRLKSHPYAFISLQDAFYDTVKVIVNATDICNLKELQLIKQRFSSGPFLPKNSPYQEFLRYMILYIREPGILWRLKSEYSYIRRCLESSDNTGRALGANDVFTAFMILIGGYMLSTTFLIIEKLFRVTRPFSYVN